MTQIEKQKIGIIIQARMGSTRLPGKTMKILVGRPMLWHIVERCRMSTRAECVVVATSSEHSDDQIEAFCKSNSIPCFRGSVDNVLERYYAAAKQFNLAVVARITADCPLVDPTVIDRVFTVYETGKYDYISNIVPGKRTFPRGLDVEVFSFEALEKAYNNAIEAIDKEHVTPYIWQNKSNNFTLGPMVKADKKLARNYRLTVDYPEDWFLIEKLYNYLYQPGKIIMFEEVIDMLDKNPELVAVNAHCEQKHMIYAPVNDIQARTT